VLRSIAIATLMLVGAGASAEPLEVCATTTSVGSLVREVGGEDVSLTVFAKGPEDPHFVEPRPSFIKKLSRADLLVLNGMELELGWLPSLLQGARNARVLRGARGYLDASSAIAPLEVPAEFDRSLGDVHPYGNPHYLQDPLNGLAVARLLRDRLSEIRPARAEAFAARYEDLARRIGKGLVGEKLAGRYDVAKLALLAEHGELESFLESQGESAYLGGWLGLLRGRWGTKAAADHNLWPYFARRFGLRMVGYLEPKPGIPPTTTHLRRLIEQMRAGEVRLILSAAYYNPAHSRFVSEQTGARVAHVAHAVGARPGTESYPKLVDYNVRQLVGNDAGS
jgi:ABC-type Zn uptake system ZnuABC Zn-binding protein ZnuA